MVVSLALFLVALLLPFDSALSMDIRLDQPPPMWFFGTLLLPVALVAVAVASAGLMRLRRWGRLLAMVASALLIAAAVLLANSPLANHVSGLATTLFTMGTSAWLCGVALSLHPSVASHLRK